MQDKESGSLSQRSVLDLVVDLYRGAVTGSLKLDRAPLQKAIFFRDGQILFAHSNDPKDQLASILVEEGKLGPDQMQVAQGSVKPGNPLAKVLTDLGYISQRELADSARIKVEKILTDLYSWTEGSYQFVTKSLKVAIADLGLSSEQLIFTSMCRVQDRDWVLNLLDSLDAVLAPGPDVDRFVSQIDAGNDAASVIRQVDGTKTVKEICAAAALGEFDVCKILAAALTLGALQKTEGASAPASPGNPANDDAFEVPSAAIPTIPPLDAAPEIGASTVGVETVGIESLGLETVGIETAPPENPAPPAIEPPESDTVFQAADNVQFGSESPETVYAAAGAEDPFASAADPFPAANRSENLGGSSSDLLLDESGGYGDDDGELGSDSLSARVAPRSSRARRGAPSSGAAASIVKIVAVIALAAGAAYSVYTFVWPMFNGSDTPATNTASNTAGTAGTASTPGGAGGGTTPQPAPPSSTPTPAPGAAVTGTAGSTPGAPPSNTVPATGSPSAGAGPRPAPPRNASAALPATSSTPPSPTPRPAPPRPSAPATASGGSGRQLLSSGDLRAAANAFRSELSATAGSKFTIAVGLYCSAENAGRVVDNAGNAADLYVLPADVQGRSCYRIVWGTFDSQRAAESTIGSLPPGIRAGDSAAVPLARVLR